MSKKIPKKSSIKSKPIQTHSSAENSFLNETSLISGVDLDIREEIEKKFKKSSVNSKYVFPRVILKSKTRNIKKSTSRPSSRPKLVTEKSLPIMHKMTKSNFDVAQLVSNKIVRKKIHRASSSIKSMREIKNKDREKNHLRTSSHLSRSKSPIEACKSIDGGLGHALGTAPAKKQNVNNRRGYYDGALNKTKTGNKKPTHLYTASIESVIPGAIIKTVSYYK